MALNFREEINFDSKFNNGDKGNWVLHHLGQTLQTKHEPGRVAQPVGHLTGKSEILGSIPSLATFFRFTFH